MRREKKKNYKLRSKTYKFLGGFTTFLTTIGGFVIYESSIDWENFKNDIENFVVVNQQTVQLNLALAFPLLISIAVYIWVSLKRNKDFFKNKFSVNLLLLIVILYLIYSIIEATLCSLIGAFVGSVIDDFGFSLAAQRNKLLAEREQDINLEYEKELRRIEARKKAEEELNGSV